MRYYEQHMSVRIQSGTNHGLWSCVPSDWLDVRALTISAALYADLGEHKATPAWTLPRGSRECGTSNLLDDLRGRNEGLLRIRWLTIDSKLREDSLRDCYLCNLTRVECWKGLRCICNIRYQHDTPGSCSRKNGGTIRLRLQVYGLYLALICIIKLFSVGGPRPNKYLRISLGFICLITSRWVAFEILLRDGLQIAVTVVVVISSEWWFVFWEACIEVHDLMFDEARG